MCVGVSEKQIIFVKKDNSELIMHIYRVADPDPGPFSPLDPGSGMCKNQDPNPGSGYGMNNPHHITESLETIFLH